MFGEGTLVNKDTAAEGLSRRTLFKIAGISATGYALAVQPLSAETIHTPDTGLVTRDIEVSRRADRMPVYLAMPEGSARRPAVIVIHEIFGQHEHIRDVARRFAREGFIAAAPELYFRDGGVKHLKDFPAILEVVRNIPDRQLLDDLGALLTHLKGLPQSNGKVGATGFCWGGGATWLLALDNPGLDAAVTWYGRLTNWGSGPLHPHNPIDLAERLHAPVLGLYGGQDNGIPVADVNAMRDKLKALGKTNEMVIYPDAPHAFHADYRPSYRPEAAKDGWGRCLAWFRKYLS
ncbi:MAG: dienelactone hydrolase family protein [Candidatus Lambdaproteobacteria bacterium]|nr:dienelactone hydrolase family protein [Candidatus Lambdaproteobacteria bacterium]